MTVSAMEPRSRRTRQTRMRTILVVGALVLSPVLIACGQQADRGPDAAPSETPAAPEPTALTCPSNEMVGMDGGLLAEMPDGFDTREQAVESWLPKEDDWGNDYVITDDGSGAWILREDGSAHARVDFLRHQGFTVHGYEACAS